MASFGKSDFDRKLDEFSDAASLTPTLRIRLDQLIESRVSEEVDKQLRKVRDAGRSRSPPPLRGGSSASALAPVGFRPGKTRTLVSPGGAHIESQFVENLDAKGKSVNAPGIEDDIGTYCHSLAS